jgi:hypothetical protein
VRVSKVISIELERHGGGNCFAPRIIGSTRGTLRHVAAGLPNQPLPFTADMQNGQIARAERGAFDWHAAVFLLCEPLRMTIE